MKNILSSKKLFITLLTILLSLSLISAFSFSNIFNFQNKNQNLYNNNNQISNNQNNNQLKVTYEHPFLLNNKWIQAQNLEIGDTLTTIDGKEARITNIKEIKTKKTLTVYNLEAGIYSNFVVGINNLIVHNSNAPTSTNLKKLREEAGPEVGIHFRNIPSSQSLASGIPEPETISLYHATNELQLLYMQRNGVRSYTFFGYDDPLVNNENFARLVGDSILRNTGDARQISNANEHIIIELLSEGYSRSELEALVNTPVIFRVRVPKSNADNFIPYKLEHPGTTTEWASKRTATGEAEVLRLDPDARMLSIEDRKQIVREFADGTRPATETVILGSN